MIDFLFNMITDNLSKIPINKDIASILAPLVTWIGIVFSIFTAMLTLLGGFFLNILSEKIKRRISNNERLRDTIVSSLTKLLDDDLSDRDRISAYDVIEPISKGGKKYNSIKLLLQKIPDRSRISTVSAYRESISDEIAKWQHR